MDDYDRNYANWAEQWAPGGPAWPKAYDQVLTTDGSRDLSLYLGPSAKRVVINDYLPAGQMFLTENEVILSKRGWEQLIQFVRRQEIVRGDVMAIIEEQMGDVLAWLRGAGHDL